MSSYDTTDPLARLAAQIAIQLPTDVAEARRVLLLSTEFLDDFLVQAASPAHRRARLLGWGVAPAEALEAASSGGAPAVLVRSTLLGLSSLLVTLPVALLLLQLFGVGAGMVFMFAVTLVAMVLGTVPALALAVTSPLLHNLLLVPPALEFSKPTIGETVAAVSYLLIALIVPWIEARRPRIRAAVIPAEAGELAEIRARMAG